MLNIQKNNNTNINSSERSRNESQIQHRNILVCLRISVKCYQIRILLLFSHRGGQRSSSTRSSHSIQQLADFKLKVGKAPSDLFDHHAHAPCLMGFCISFDCVVAICITAEAVSMIIIISHWPQIECWIKITQIPCGLCIWTGANLVAIILFPNLCLEFHSPGCEDCS